MRSEFIYVILHLCAPVYFCVCGCVYETLDDSILKKGLSRIRSEINILLWLKYLYHICFQLERNWTNFCLRPLGGLILYEDILLP